MKIKFRLITSVLLMIVIFFQLTSLFLDNKIYPGQIAGLTRQYKSVKVSAYVGKYRFTLFGFSSPLALVTLDGQGIHYQTTADDRGYFQFVNLFSPFSPHEAYLSSKDQFGRISAPIYLPPFPTQYDITIGPVIIPPTISLDKKDYFLGDEVILSGQSVPNTEIKLSIFGDAENKSKINSIFGSKISDFSLIKPVEAFAFPELIAQSDDKGNFSISLPSSQTKSYRLFTQVDYQDNPSANSQTLMVKILPFWMIIVTFFLFIFSFIQPRLLEIAIVLEIIYILYVIRGHYFEEKSIILYQDHLPAIEQSRLPIIKERLLY